MLTLDCPAPCLSNDPSGMLRHAEFYATMACMPLPTVRRIATMGLTPHEAMCHLPTTWHDNGERYFLRLFRAAQFAAASIAVGGALGDRLSLSRGLLALARAGECEKPDTLSMRRRGNRWAFEGWRAITAEADAPELKNTLDRIRSCGLPIISPHGLLAVMIADDHDRDRMLMANITQTFAR